MQAWLMAGLLVMSAGSLRAQRLPDLEAEETPLHWAAEHGLYSITEQLMTNGAPADAPDQFGRTPLHRAVPYTDVVLLLLDSGADVNAADMFGRTPLHAALPYRGRSPFCWMPVPMSQPRTFSGTPRSSARSDMEPAPETSKSLICFSPQAPARPETAADYSRG